MLTLFLQYKVLPLTSVDLTARQETLVNPQDDAASPFGWHNTGFTNSTYTSYAASFWLHWVSADIRSRGNNCLAGYNITDNAPNRTLANGGDSLTFDYPYNVSQSPTDNRIASITQGSTFYIISLCLLLPLTLSILYNQHDARCYLPLWIHGSCLQLPMEQSWEGGKGTRSGLDICSRLLRQ